MFRSEPEKDGVGKRMIRSPSETQKPERAGKRMIGQAGQPVETFLQDSGETKNLQGPGLATTKFGNGFRRRPGRVIGHDTERLEAQAAQQERSERALEKRQAKTLKEYTRTGVHPITGHQPLAVDQGAKHGVDFIPEPVVYRSMYRPKEVIDKMNYVPYNDDRQLLREARGEWRKENIRREGMREEKDWSVADQFACYDGYDVPEELSMKGARRLRAEREASARGQPPSLSPLPPPSLGGEGLPPPPQHSGDLFSQGSTPGSQRSGRSGGEAASAASSRSSQAPMRPSQGSFSQGSGGMGSSPGSAIGVGGPGSAAGSGSGATPPFQPNGLLSGGNSAASSPHSQASWASGNSSSGHTPHRLPSIASARTPPGSPPPF